MWIPYLPGERRRSEITVGVSTGNGQDKEGSVGKDERPRKTHRPTKVTTTGE